MRQRVSQQAKDARRRLRTVTSQNCGKVVARSCYWTVEFLHLFLDLCDAQAFDAPDDGYALAVQAPELARRVRVCDEAGHGAGHYANSAEKHSARVLALSVLGSCSRAAGRLSEADAAFGLAFDLAFGRDSGMAPELAHRSDACKDAQRADFRDLDLKVIADLRRRHAVLLLQTGRNGIAEEIEASLELCRRAEWSAGLADALLLRGVWLTQTSKSGAVDYAEAMRLADQGTPRGRRTFSGAVQNLALAITTHGVSLPEQESAYRLLQRVREMLAKRPKSVRKMKVYWTEGLLLSNLGVSRHAARRLAKARAGFAELSSPVDFVLVTLDLASIYRQDGELKLLRQLVENTFETMASLSDDPRLMELIEPWRRSPAATVNVAAAVRELAGLSGVSGLGAVRGS